jgi:hypothetical protein
MNGFRGAARESKEMNISKNFRYPNIMKFIKKVEKHGPRQLFHNSNKFLQKFFLRMEELL